MELLLFIAFVVIIILLVKLRSDQKEIASRTHQSFLSLKKELIEIKEAGNKIKKSAAFRQHLYYEGVKTALSRQTPVIFYSVTTNLNPLP